MKIKVDLPKWEFIDNLNEFFHLFKWYLQKKLLDAGFRFEKVKDFFVEKLLWRRGRLSRPFLTSTFFLLVTTAVVIAPIVKNRYPTLGKEEKEFTSFASQVVLTTTQAHAVETTTQESIKPRDKIITYKVEKGDTLSSIAKKFFGRDDELAIKTILWENNLNDANDIKPDQEIKILPAPGIAHRVQPGDTIYSIATKYNSKNEKAGANAQKIVDFPFNNFLDDETFALAVSNSDDDYIFVPDGIKPEPKPVQIAPVYFAQIPDQTTSSTPGLFSWPLGGSISQYFSWYHQAIDIAQDIGTPIIAAASGRVIVADASTWGYGYHVIVDHGNGYQTLYAHLANFAVSVGESVSSGQPVGSVGLTGRTTGPHLHFEIRQNGALVNPLLFLGQ